MVTLRLSCGNEFLVVTTNTPQISMVKKGKTYEKRIFILGLIVAFCLGISTSAFADTEKPNEKIIVNKEDNSITFVYDDSDANLSSSPRLCRCARECLV